MGLFKKMKAANEALGAVPDMLDQAKQMQAQGAAMQAEAAGIMSGEVDEALLAPIEGVDLQTYAKCAKKQVEGGLTQDEFNQWLVSQGLNEKQYAVAASGWVTRMRENLALSTRYGTVYQHTNVD